MVSATQIARRTSVEYEHNTFLDLERRPAKR
jgi:hypothetical protein